MGTRRLLVSGFLILSITSTVLFELLFLDFVDESTKFSTGNTFEQALSSYLRASITTTITTDHHRRVRTHQQHLNDRISSQLHPSNAHNKNGKSLQSVSSSASKFLATITEISKGFELEGENKDDKAVRSSANNNNNDLTLEGKFSKEVAIAKEVAKRTEKKDSKDDTSSTEKHDFIDSQDGLTKKELIESTETFDARDDVAKRKRDEEGKSNEKYDVGFIENDDQTNVKEAKKPSLMEEDLDEEKRVGTSLAGDDLDENRLDGLGNKTYGSMGEPGSDALQNSTNNSKFLPLEARSDPKNGARDSLFPKAGGGVAQIYLLPPMKLEKRTANAKHLMNDGVIQSPLLNFTEDFDNFDSNVVWVLDLLSAREKWSTASDPRYWCVLMQSKIHEAQQRRKAANLPTEWPIAIVDNRDFAIISNCTEIGEAVGDHNVRYSYRSLVDHRDWSELEQWVEIGERLDPATFPSKYDYRHRPIGVRTDTVAAIELLVKKEFDMKLCDAIEEIERPIDVSYLWDFGNFTLYDASLRDTVYQILDDLDKKKPWNMVIGLRGENAVDGRKKVSSEYVETLIRSKIIVVAQRDRWEDHYRLFEAIVSGTLVLTDKMLSLPRGLKHGESVVEYTDADDLRNKLEFYLAHPEERMRVARNGRFVAMSQHRSWHHMEEIVFGAPVTVCSEKAGSRCPFIVNTSQINEDC